MTITAKFASICPTCKCSISPGDKVEWSRGQKATHTSCSAGPRSAQPATAPRLQARRAGRRTGCSCGGREDSSGCLIPSDHNCRQCEFDGE